jgi:two-component system OmpR family sensor kinase
MKRWLLAWLICGCVVVSAAAAYLIFRTAKLEAGELFDYELHAVAISLPRGADSDLAIEQSPDFEGIADDGIAIQIWDRAGQIGYRSAASTALPRLPDGFHNVEVAGRGWRVFGYTDGDRVIQVAQPAAIRNQLALKLAARVLWPLALLFPCALLLVWFVVTRGLRPLATLSDLIATRSADVLDPLRVDDSVSSEFMPLIKRMNDLLERLDAALRSQRQFVADAAHELRSPLAALKLQFQLACQDGALPGNPALLSKIDGRLNRTIHLVQQLLTLAREDAGLTPTAGAFDLAEVAARVVGDASILAEQKHIDLGLLWDAGRQVPAVGAPDAIAVLLANLVDNAIRYTPAGGRVDVSIGWQEEYAWVDVTDSGPGIPSHELDRVFDRFYRVAGSAAHGSGLGLAIARRIADRHHADLRVSNRNPGPGLTARLHLYYHDSTRTAPEGNPGP